MYKIVINKTTEKKDILILDDDKLVEKYEETESTNRIEGNIYIGKIEKIINGMQAAFVDIGEKSNAFIHFKDMLEEKPNLKKPILVQVKKDASQKKGAKLSSNISITGRFFVLMPYESFITVSQKIENEEEKERLKLLAKELLPEGFGAIIRTSAMKKAKKELEKDIKNLINKWEEVKDIEVDNIPKLVYKNDSIILKLLRDLVDQNLEKVVTNDKEIYNQVRKELEQFETKIKVELNNDVMDSIGLKTQVERSQDRKIWLKSGAFITIDKTEALTAIDVNSGKYLGNNNLEQTSYEVNAEATKEIARQIRLKDIGGIIIIDYIDMHKEENKEKIIMLLKECCKKDRSKIQIAEFTKLNLLELTRKHMFSND